MKAVNILILLLTNLIIYSQNELIFESSYMDFEDNTCLLKDYQYDKVEFAIIEHKRISPFKASFYKSYSEKYVLVEIDSTSDYQFVELKYDSVFIKTSLNRFVIPVGKYSVQITFAPCKFMKTFVDVRACHSDLKYTLVPPTLADDDGMLIIHPDDESSWYFYHNPTHRISSDTLYNVHTGYYEIYGESTYGCKEIITIPVIHQGGNLEDLETFDFARVVVTKG